MTLERGAWVKGLAILIGIAGGASSAAGAQNASGPNLIFSITGGLTSGGDLWSVPSQPRPVIGSNPVAFDTMELSRKLRPGIVAGLAATYFTGRTIGLTAEMMYFGIATEQRCIGLAIDTTVAGQINRQACTRANGTHVATSVVGFMIGGTYRILPDGPVEPFVRATVGPGLLNNSFIETAGVIQSLSCGTSDNLCVFPLLRDPGQRQITFVTNVSAGLTFRISQGYRARFEGRDVITSVPVVAGAAPPTGNTPPTGRAIKHIATFTIGLDVILERRHTRRY